MNVTSKQKQRHSPHRSKSCGFTLLEILVAMVILTVGLLGMASLCVGIIKGNELSKEVSSATTCAREKVEDMERMGFANTTAGTVTEGYSAISNYPEYKRETIITDNTPATDMKSVQVTVYWDSDNHQVQLRTFLAK